MIFSGNQGSPGTGAAGSSSVAGHWPARVEWVFVRETAPPPAEPEMGRKRAASAKRGPLPPFSPGEKQCFEDSGATKPASPAGGGGFNSPRRHLAGWIGTYLRVFAFTTAMEGSNRQEGRRINRPIVGQFYLPPPSASCHPPQCLALTFRCAEGGWPPEASASAESLLPGPGFFRVPQPTFPGQG